MRVAAAGSLQPRAHSLRLFFALQKSKPSRGLSGRSLKQRLSVASAALLPKRKVKGLWKLAATKVEVRLPVCSLISRLSTTITRASSALNSVTSRGQQSRRPTRPFPPVPTPQKLAKAVIAFKPLGSAKTKAVPFGANAKALGWGTGPAVNERLKMLQGKHGAMVKRLEAPMVRAPAPRPHALGG